MTPSTLLFSFYVSLKVPLSLSLKISFLSLISKAIKSKTLLPYTAQTQRSKKPTDLGISLYLVSLSSLFLLARPSSLFFSHSSSSSLLPKSKASCSLLLKSKAIVEDRRSKAAQKPQITMNI
ncbi:hypothetical protein AMTRI_Chr09g19470 [Amborella trichopoda]